jgi:hypothetical protein
VPVSVVPTKHTHRGLWSCSLDPANKFRGEEHSQNGCATGEG